MAANELAHSGEVQRIRMVDDTNSKSRRKPERYGEAERMEKRKDSEQTIMPVEHERLRNLLDIRADVVVR